MSHHSMEKQDALEAVIILRFLFIKQKIPALIECTFSKWEEASHNSEYSWPLKNIGVRGTDTLCSWKSMYNFWLPQNLTINSLLLTRNLTDNIKSIITYVVCYMYIYMYFMHSWYNFLLILLLFLGQVVSLVGFFKLLSISKIFSNIFMEKTHI